jgi:hypothetical protein
MFINVLRHEIQAGKSGVRFLIRSQDFSIDLILLAELRLWESTHPLIEIVFRNLPGIIGRLARQPDHLRAICEPELDNVGSSATHNPIGLHGLLNFALPFRETRGYCERGN